MNIKPIETVYNGYRFRSRLEARWAVFFRAVGIEYQYEPEGFDMDGKPITIRAREELAIVFQHEIDHLNGILFIDRIDPKNPFKGQTVYRAI